MLTLRLVLLLLCLLASHANGIQPWLNTSLPTEARLQLFLSQLSSAQNFNMTQGAESLETDQCIGNVAGNTTLGVPAVWMGDGPAGVGNDLNKVTAFPPLHFPGVDLVANYSEGLYVGYRWYDEFGVETLFPFSHSLSYTRFEFSGLSVDKRTVKNTDFIVEISLRIHNAGPVAGKEIAQLYNTCPEEGNEPPKVLKGFQKTPIDVSETAYLKFSLTKEDLSIWSEETGDWDFILRAYAINVGSSSQDIRLKRAAVL